MSRRALIADVALGAIAGAAATWAMDRTTTLLFERQSPAITRREKKARGGKSAYQNAARKLLGNEDLASALHWSVGVGSGALYGLLRNRSKHVGIGSGLAFGLAMYLGIDEGLLAATKLSPPPARFPWQTHARGLAGHLVLGAMLDAAFDVTDLVA